MKFLWGIAFILSAGIAHADVIELQALSFGEFALRDNVSNYQMTVSPAGGLSYDTAIVPIISPVEGIYQVTGQPPSTALIINVTFNDLASLDGGDDFTISTPVISPASVSSDGAGNASFSLGATLTTSGGGGFYPNSAYNGSITVSVNF